MKLLKWIAITHTPSTNLINIPSRVVKDMDIKYDNDVQVEYDSKEKVLKITKIKEQ